MRRDYDLMRLKSFMSSRHSRVLCFSVDQEPFKKGGSTSATNRRKVLVEAFANSLLEEMQRKKLKKLKADVALDFYFSSSEDSHPDHTSLIKNYVDIVRDVVLDDDRQVSVIESYHAQPKENFRPGKGSLRVTITPMGIYEAKHALLQSVTDSSHRSISQRLSSEDDSPDELIEVYEWALKSAKDEKSKAMTKHTIERLHEEKAMGYFWPYDFPFNFTSKLWGDLGMNKMLEKWRSEQRGIIIPIPYTAQNIVDETKKYLAQRGISAIQAHQSIDINIEVINWSIENVSKDIDNIFIDVKKAYFNSGIFAGSFGGVRIYRYEDKLDSTPRLRIKLLLPLEVFFHIRGLEEQADEKFRELEREF